MTQTLEALGPAERIIQSLLTYTDHLMHDRPGIVRPGAGPTGVVWSPVTHRVVGSEKQVFALTKVGRKVTETPLGVLQSDGVTVRNGGRTVIGQYRKPGLFPEVAKWMYSQVADVYKLNNELVARWASHAFTQTSQDMKTVLAAFLLVQARKGDPVYDRSTDLAKSVVFYDEDYRDVGEAMCLIYESGITGLSPKILLRIYRLLSLPVVAEINRALGFFKGARKPFYGRWEPTVHKWLRYREENPGLMAGLLKAGYRKTVIELSAKSHYKPATEKFFEMLRWEQTQSKDGHRVLGIGKKKTKAETWEGLTEKQVCEKICKERPRWLKIVGMVPSSVGITPAVMSAAIESGCLSDKDLIIATPTIEKLGLLNDKDVKARWEAALKKAEDTRGANIAQRVRFKETREKLEGAAETAVKKAVEKVAKNVRVYFMVDISGSMDTSIEPAKEYLKKFLYSFPLDRLHISTFNTVGQEIKLKHPSAAGVDVAFAGIMASGGTSYGAGVRALQQYKPTEDEDVIFIFVGDEQASEFTHAVASSGLRPAAFGLVRLGPESIGRAVQDTAIGLQIPLFRIDGATFSDPYAIPRTIQALVASTPVAAARPGVARETLISTIMKTELLKKPAWAI